MKAILGVLGRVLFTEPLRSVVEQLIVRIVDDSFEQSTEKMQLWRVAASKRTPKGFVLLY